MINRRFLIEQRGWDPQWRGGLTLYWRNDTASLGTAKEGEIVGWLPAGLQIFWWEGEGART